MGPIRCPETSVKDYHSTLRNNQNSADLINIAAEAWYHGQYTAQEKACYDCIYYNIYFQH
jgi:hypothetical protein